MPGTRHRSDSSSPVPQPETGAVFLITWMILYSAVVFGGLFIHAMWRDEIHPWAMAGSSGSLAELLRMKSVEGHPDLWYILVYAIRSVNADPLALQVVHGCFAVFTAFLVLKFAPFSRSSRVLILFGYFFLFEYAVITRNYAAGLLLVTMVLVIWPGRKQKLPVIALLLALLAQMSIFGLILSVTFAMTLAFEAIWDQDSRQAFRKQWKSVIASACLLAAAIAWSLHSVTPPSSAYFAGHADFTLSQLTLKKTILTLAVPWRAWVPIPHPGDSFWESHLFSHDLMAAVLSLISGTAMILILRRKPVPLFAFLTGTTGILAFLMLYYFGFPRHHGHLFILLIACIWISKYQPVRRKATAHYVPDSPAGFLQKHKYRLFTALLIIQAGAGVYATLIHSRVPFSASREAAGFIRRNGYDRFTLAGDRDIALEPVAGYLDKPAFYFSRNAFSRYLVYDTLRKNPDHATVLRMADSLATVLGDTLVLVMSSPLDSVTVANGKSLAEFQRSIRYDEKYFLYLMWPKTDTADLHGSK